MIKSLSIGKTAQYLGVSTVTLRRWEKHKLIISDLGSGLNFKKEGLNQLIKLVVSGQVYSIYLTHKERLMRFGSELFFNICNYFGTKIIILNCVENKSFESTLVEDVIELITVFSAKLYGKRSHQNKKLLN